MAAQTSACFGALPVGLVHLYHLTARYSPIITLSKTLSELSTATKDYAKEGFVARNQSEEMRKQRVSLWDQLVSIQDVTARVNGVVKEGMSAQAQTLPGAPRSPPFNPNQRRRPACADVVTLYQGGIYNLYRYKKYNDVRIVFVPEFQAAFLAAIPTTSTFPFQPRHGAGAGL